jgi:hypothetical protein
VSTTPTFSWSPVSGANLYWLIVATNPSYLPTDPAAKTAPGCIISTNVSGTSYSSSTLSPGTTYYWEVQAFYRAQGVPDHLGNYSSIWTFTTAQAQGIYIGATVKTTAKVNVRVGPGLSYSIIIELPTNVYGIVQGGPSYVDGYYWWYCTWSYNGTTYTGWSVENYIALAP